MIIDAMPNARQTALRSRGNLEPDEAIGIAYFTLVKIAPRFDPARGVTFWQYARQRIVWELQEAMRKYQVTGHRDRLVSVEVVTLDDEDKPLSIRDNRNHENQMIARVCVERAVEATRPRSHNGHGLQGRPHIFAVLMARGWTVGDIRQSMRISHSLAGVTKRQAMFRMRQELGA
jgi:hypothetical protein